MNGMNKAAFCILLLLRKTIQIPAGMLFHSLITNA